LNPSSFGTIVENTLREKKIKKKCFTVTNTYNDEEFQCDQKIYDSEDRSSASEEEPENLPRVSSKAARASSRPRSCKKAKK